MPYARLFILLLIPLAHAASQEAPSPAQSPLDFANGLFQRGFFNEAVDEYEKYLAVSPAGAEAVTAWLRMGEAAYAGQQYEKALGALDEALKEQLDEGQRQQAALSRAEVLYHLKRFPEAEQALAELAKPETAPDLRGRALYYLGRSHAAQQQHASAVKTFTTFLEQLPQDRLANFARYELAFALMAQPELEKAAIEFGNVAASEAPEELRRESRFRAAEIYDKMGWYDAAVGAYEQLKKDFPESEYAERADNGYAWALYRAQKPEQALAAADALLAAKPDSTFAPGLKYLRGNALQQLKRYDEALAAFNGLRQEHGESPYAVQAQYKAAWMHFLREEIALAKNEVLAFINVHQDTPLLSDAHFLLGSIYVAENNYDEAQKEFRLVVEKYPASQFAPEALYQAAECLGQLGLSQESARTFAEFSTRFPEHELAAQAMLRAGRAQFDAKEFTQAAATYQELLKRPLEPGVEQETLYSLALSHHNAKAFAESAAIFEQLLQKHPEAPQKLEAQFRIAEHALKEGGDAAKAMLLYQSVLDGDPKGAFAGPALRGLALAHYELKEQDLAAGLFLRLAEEYPELRLNEETYVWIGQHFFDAEQWEQAVKSFERLLAAVPDYPYPDRVHLMMAEARERSGDAEAALAGYQKVVELAPEGSSAAEARFRMAKLFETQNETDKARELYEAAASAGSGDTAARAQFRLGELYESLGEHDKAARSFLRVEVLFLHEELSPQALWRAGENFVKIGSLDQARRAFEDLLQDYPQSEFAAKAAESLGKLGEAT